MKILENRNNLGSYLNELGLTNIGVEIGVQKGHFSEIVLSQWKGKKYYCVDAWEKQSDDVYIDGANVNDTLQTLNMKETEDRLKRFKNRYELIKGYSTDQNILNKFINNSLDFVYIDARHDYNGVMEDIVNWYPKVKVGGLVCGHDYGMDGIWEGQGGIWGDFGVTRAIQEWNKQYRNMIFSTFEQICKTFYFIKKEVKN